MPLMFKDDLCYMGGVLGSNEVRSRNPIFDHFFEQLKPYIGNNDNVGPKSVVYQHEAATLHIPTQNNSEM